jgi:hypothetical protein
MRAGPIMGSEPGLRPFQRNIGGFGSSWFRAVVARPTGIEPEFPPWMCAEIRAGGAACGSLALGPESGRECWVCCRAAVNFPLPA